MYKSFIAGIGIGIGLGILFAPMSGEETRNNLRDRAGDLGDQAREAFEQGRTKFNEKFSTIRGGVQNAMDTATESFNNAATGTEGV
jgi:gas vesicle protein